MGAIPNTKNKAVIIAKEFIRILIQVGDKAAITFLTGLAPQFLANPFAQFLLEKIVSFIGEILRDLFAKGATVLIIDIQTHAENSAIVRARTALTYAEGGNDAESIKKAKDELIKCWGNLIHWDGTA